MLTIIRSVSNWTRIWREMLLTIQVAYTSMTISRLWWIEMRAKSRYFRQLLKTSLMLLLMVITGLYLPMVRLDRVRRLRSLEVKLHMNKEELFPELLGIFLREFRMIQKGTIRLQSLICKSIMRMDLIFLMLISTQTIWKTCLMCECLRMTLDSSSSKISQCIEQSLKKQL